MQESKRSPSLQIVRKKVSCTLKVHSDCYGTLPQEDWACDNCSYQGARCNLCPPQHASSSLSPLRRSSEMAWVHLICNSHLGMRFVKEAYLDKEDLQFAVKGIENLDDVAFCLRCSICGSTMTGLCVNCAEPACPKSFHPLCAISSGYKTSPPSIFCPDHSSPVKNEQVQLAPHKIKDQKKSKTKHLNFKYVSSSKNPKRSRNTKVTNDFDKVKEYFVVPSQKILTKTALPYDKSGFTLPSIVYHMSNKCRVLFQGPKSHFLMNFSVTPHAHMATQCNEEFVIVPRYGDIKNLKYELVLENRIEITKETSQDYELLSRCLNETIPAEDEVTKEILYSLEYFSRKVIPVVNTNKELLSRLIEKKRKIDMSEVQKICTQSWICMQWTLIYKNLKSGLQDKSIDYYDSREEANPEIKKIDCAICFNYDEENAILNPVVYCFGCRLFMHRACIGIQNPPDEFYCQVCLSKSNPRCLLCSCKEWPMKCVDSEWFHISCALWDQRVEFTDKQFLEGIILNGISRLGCCFICKKPNGPLSECKECQTLCHLMCAWRNGYKFYTNELSTPQRRLQAGFICEKHFDERDYATQKQLRYNAFINYLSPRLQKKRSREIK